MDDRNARMMAASAAMLLVLGACDKLREKPPDPYEIVVYVQSDPGEAVEGADIMLGANKVASTDADGKAKLKLRGEEGEALTFGIRCPEGYQMPKPLGVTLRRIADPTKMPEYEATCPPLTRTMVVAVRADKGPNLPVMHLGREVARTDASGAAHVVLKMRPDESFQLMLNTSETEEGERLRPQDPVATFRVRHHDDVVTFDQTFKVERKVYYRRPKPKGPTRLDTR